MKLWNSIVGKIWSTIILLLIGVLVICGFLVAVIYEKNNFNEIKAELDQDASKIIGVMHKNDAFISENGEGSESLTLLDDTIGVIIAKDNESVYVRQSTDKVSQQSIEKLTKKSKK
ncbi:putative two-component sensor histidine kinase ResE [Listeria fleischmannii FSL S10-1203]|uniref:Putative two-component sensor histidine kinase ResE n=1 Tax=Listeria fleischmannii FSL S10-1203 TaxID=1265822 RepID=W7DEI0_9LIST|nr:putative two-component sensor histidine kinase ResE [Listeria fleischmannii FSL S10-1203]